MRQLKNFSNKKGKTISDDETVKEYIKKYDGYNEDQLVDELIKAVKKSKEEGTYSEQQMDMFINMVSPQLNERQKAKLQNMITLIKAGEI